jgi:hypothetical protein
MFILCVIIGVVSLAVILSPFFRSSAHNLPLQAGSAISSAESLKKIKEAILERYLEDEQAFEKKLLSSRVWKARKSYLVGRYIDTVRRLDFLAKNGTGSET